MKVQVPFYRLLMERIQLWEEAPALWWRWTRDPGKSPDSGGNLQVYPQVWIQEMLRRGFTEHEERGLALVRTLWVVAVVVTFSLLLCEAQVNIREPQN